MNKYVALFCIPADSIQEWLANTDEEARNQQTSQLMQEWNTWKETHKDSIVEEGYPLGKTKHVSKESITDTKNDLNWVMILQADSHEAAAELVQSHPHLQVIPSAYVELMDSNRMGGAS